MQSTQVLYIYLNRLRFTCNSSYVSFQDARLLLMVPLALFQAQTIQGIT